MLTRHNLPAVSSSYTVKVLDGAPSMACISLPHRGRGTTKWWKELLTSHIIMNYF